MLLAESGIEVPELGSADSVLRRARRSSVPRRRRRNDAYGRLVNRLLAAVTRD